jgi:hypothetical protein
MQRQDDRFDHDLQLHPLAGLGFAHLGAPFFARMNVASASNSLRSSNANRNRAKRAPADFVPNGVMK